MSFRPERPTCFLHIGPPKTGSSTISHFVENNAAALESHGVFIPKMSTLTGRPQNGHGIFANVREIDGSGSLKPGAKLWPELEAVAREGKLNILLTSESFTHAFRHKDRLEVFLTFFERHNYNVRVVAYLRDQPSSLNSTYVQTQKRLMKRWTFDEFLQDSADRGRVDPWRWLEHIVDNPRLSLDVGSFEQAVKGGLEADFARRIGMPADLELEAVKVRNPNAGQKAVYAAQRILAETDEGVFKSPTYKRVYRRFRTHFEKLGWTDSPYVALDEETYAKIREHYRDANERFAEKYLGAPWSELSPDRTYVKSVFDPATANPDDLREIDEVVADIVEAIKAGDAETPKRKIEKSSLGKELRKERRETRRAARAASGKVGKKAALLGDAPVAAADNPKKKKARSAEAGVAVADEKKKKNKLNAGVAAGAAVSTSHVEGAARAGGEGKGPGKGKGQGKGAGKGQGKKRSEKQLDTPVAAE